MMDRKKRNPFTCYFCNKKIDNDTEMGHTSVCGNVLVPCPYKCGAYVPRMELSFHQKECVNRTGRSMTRLTTTTESVESYEDGLSSVSLDRIKPMPNRDLYEKLQKDLQKLSTRLAMFEMGSSSWRNSHDGIKDMENVKHQNQVLLEWKKGVDFKLELLKQSVSGLEKNRNDNELHWMQVQQKFMELEKLNMDLNSCRDTFLKEQNYNRQANLEFAKNLDQFKDLFDQENATVGALWNDHKRVLGEVRSNIDTIRQQVDEQKAKYSSVVFDIKTISQIASETAEKLEIQDREFANFKKEMEQLRLDLEILENLATADSKSSPGHLIWKITDFEEKMTKAKDSNTVVKSPIFYTHEFGYKIRMLVYLNGLKKWKGRYCLLSIHVLKGEFDDLLKWPCHIEGSVSLRDVENVENPKNFHKRIAAKRQSGDEENEEPQESSFSYIFIPHSTLTKSQYLKNDAAYLEMRIDQNRKLLTETTL